METEYIAVSRLSFLNRPIYSRTPLDATFLVRNFSPKTMRSRTVQSHDWSAKIVSRMGSLLSRRMAFGGPSGIFQMSAVRCGLRV